MFTLFYAPTILNQFILLITGLTILLLTGENLKYYIRKIYFEIRSFIANAVCSLMDTYKKVIAIKVELASLIRNRHFLIITLVNLITDDSSSYCEINSCSMCTSHGKSIYLHFFRKKVSDCSEENE